MLLESIMEQIAVSCVYNTVLAVILKVEYSVIGYRERGVLKEH